MRTILIIGAGKSTAYLVQYLLQKSEAEQLRIILADKNSAYAEKLINQHPNGQAIAFDVFDKQQREKEIKKADIVVSMLPARFHIEVAKDCLRLSKNMVTASYVSNEMQALHKDAEAKGLMFLNEMGVDPGIDHMSAMAVIDRIKASGGEMLLFESFTGGLVAPESDDNLWNYKFTWNPRNVVTAGQGGAAKFLQEGKFKYIPYHRLFRRTEFLEVDGYGRFEAYANRDSLKYQNIYGLDAIQTLYRGTIRRVGFGKAWQIFIMLGMTDDSYTIEDSEHMSYRDFVNSFLPYSHSDSVELKLRHQLKIDQDDIIWEKLEELDLLIYLRSSIPNLVSQIQKRGRDYENSISIDYLSRLNERYEAWIHNYKKGRLLIIDVDDLDFVENKEDLGGIITKIGAEINGLF